MALPDSKWERRGEEGRGKREKNGKGYLEIFHLNAYQDTSVMLLFHIGLCFDNLFTHQNAEVIT